MPAGDGLHGRPINGALVTMGYILVLDFADTRSSSRRLARELHSGYQQGDKDADDRNDDQDFDEGESRRNSGLREQAQMVFFKELEAGWSPRPKRWRTAERIG